MIGSLYTILPFVIVLNAAFLAFSVQRSVTFRRQEQENGRGDGACGG